MRSSQIQPAAGTAIGSRGPETATAAVRWNTVTWAAWKGRARGSSGSLVHPVLITADPLAGEVDPLRPFGRAATRARRDVSMPAISGMFGRLRKPTAVITARERIVRAPSRPTTAISPTRRRPRPRSSTAPQSRTGCPGAGRTRQRPSRSNVHALPPLAEQVRVGKSTPNRCGRRSGRGRVDAGAGIAISFHQVPPTPAFFSITAIDRESAWRSYRRRRSARPGMPAPITVTVKSFSPGRISRAPASAATAPPGRAPISST